MIMMVVVVIALLLESRSPAQVYHSVLAPAHHREKLWFGRMTVNKWEDRLYLDVLLALRWKKVFDKAPHISCGGGAINQVKWKPSWQIMLRRRGSFLLLAFWHIYALYHAERVILRLVRWSKSENCRLAGTNLCKCANSGSWDDKAEILMMPIWIFSKWHCQCTFSSIF